MVMSILTRGRRPIRQWCDPCPRRPTTQSLARLRIGVVSIRVDRARPGVGAERASLPARSWRVRGGWAGRSAPSALILFSAEHANVAAAYAAIAGVIERCVCRIVRHTNRSGCRFEGTPHGLSVPRRGQRSSPAARAGSRAVPRRGCGGWPTVGMYVARLIGSSEGCRGQVTALIRKLGGVEVACWILPGSRWIGSGRRGRERSVERLAPSRVPRRC
jgi:hypothetical protein